jgi:predicted ATPase
VGAVSLRLLGGFEAAVDGVVVPESAWRLKKARELVKLLALAPGHRLHREQVMDVLWRDRAPAAAANNLHQAVHIARRALDPAAIDSQNEVLSLTAAIDVDRFELAAADARLVKTPAAYRAALALYAGELLPENRYDDWAEGRREELAALILELEEEFSAFGPAASFGLPVDASSFVGRERELAELRSLLGKARLVTLSGTGGTGKTRLALEFARGAEPTFEAGAALVELAELTDPRLIPDAIAASLDLRALPGQDLVDAVIGFLAPRRLLLVLDNCEHVLVAAASLVDALLRAAPRVTVVATSREPLRVAGEIVFRVPSLDIPDPEQTIRPPQLREYEAVSLFVERAAAVSPGFTLDGQNADDVARICFRLDGLPLALELAAGRVGALSPGAIAERLDDRFRLLRAGNLAGPTRQQTLTATLQWSHDLLEPDERILFRRLAIFAGSFELEAVEEVGAAGDDLEPARIADLLARLAEKSLVAVGEAGRGRRYRLLETVRMYARERLDEAGEWPLLAERHARWALALAEREQGSPRLDRDAANLRAALGYLLDTGSGDAVQLAIALLPFWLRRIDLEEARRTFAAVVEAAPDGTALRAEALLAAAAIEFRSGTLAEGFALAERSYAVASEIGDKHHEWRALQALGEFGVASDSVDEALVWLERALALARSEGFEAAEAIGVHSLGVARWILDDLVSAEELVAQSIERFRAREGTADTIPSPLNIAEIRLNQPAGRPGLRHIFEDTLQPLLQISCGAAVSYALANQAGIARVRGDLGRARALLDESTTRFEAARDEAGLATVLVRRAYTALAEGELGEARTQLGHALELRGRLSDRRGRGLVLSGLGLVAITAGEHAVADRYLTEARDIFRRAGDRWGLASTLWRIADLAIERGHLDEAEAALREARAVLAATGRERWIASTIAGLAEVSLLRGDARDAVELLADAQRRYAVSNDTVGLADVEERLERLAKEPLSPSKETAATTTPRQTKARKGRT